MRDSKPSGFGLDAGFPVDHMGQSWTEPTVRDFPTGRIRCMENPRDVLATVVTSLRNYRAGENEADGIGGTGGPGSWAEKG